MPLSEHEQRILQELEASLSAQDPGFAEKVRNETVYRHAGRRLKWGALGFVGGLIVLLVCFTISPALGFVGVGIMFASALLIHQSLRSMGRASWHDLTRSLTEDTPSGAAGVEDRIHDARDWLKDRFRRDETE